jgi:hypothetical protein
MAVCYVHRLVAGNLGARQLFSAAVLRRVKVVTNVEEVRHLQRLVQVKVKWIKVRHLA